MNTGCRKVLSKQKDNGGRQPRSESRGKYLDPSTAAPPLHFIFEHCSPTPAGGSSHTNSICSSRLDFPKDTSEECEGQEFSGTESFYSLLYLAPRICVFVDIGIFVLELLTLPSGKMGAQMQTKTDPPL